jgi:hypothetical protein
MKGISGDRLRKIVMQSGGRVKPERISSKNNPRYTK